MLQVQSAHRHWLLSRLLPVHKEIKSKFINQQAGFHPNELLTFEGAGHRCTFWHKTPSAVTVHLHQLLLTMEPRQLNQVRMVSSRASIGTFSFFDITFETALAASTFIAVLLCCGGVCCFEQGWPQEMKYSRSGLTHEETSTAILCSAIN